MNCDVGEPFRHFTYITTHSPTLPTLYLRHSSFSNPSVALPTSLLILQPFSCFTYVTTHSPTLLSLLLRHKQSSFSNLTVTSPTSQLTLQPFRRFTYATAHSPTLPLLYLRYSLQPFFRFSYVTSSSLNSPGEPPMQAKKSRCNLISQLEKDTIIYVLTGFKVK